MTKKDQKIPKDWNDIQSDFAMMQKMSCTPVSIKKVAENHIFDEERTVKWNREQCEANNRRYQEEVARLNTAKNKRRDKIMEDIYFAIQSEVGVWMNREQAKVLWDTAYRQGHSYGMHQVKYELDDLISAVTQIYALKDH